MKEEDIGRPLIGLQLKIEDNDFSDVDVNLSNSKDELRGENDGSSKEVNGANSENAEANIAYLD